MLLQCSNNLGGFWLLFATGFSMLIIGFILGYGVRVAFRAALAPTRAAALKLADRFDADFQWRTDLPLGLKPAACRTRLNHAHTLGKWGARTSEWPWWRSLRLTAIWSFGRQHFHSVEPSLQFRMSSLWIVLQRFQIADFPLPTPRGFRYGEVRRGEPRRTP